MPLVSLRTPQPLVAAVAVPMSPQPKRSLAHAPNAAQPLHAVKLHTPPTSQSPQPGPLCSVAKNSFAPQLWPAQVWPDGSAASTSACEAQTWKSAAQRSAAAQPVPLTLVLELPSTRPQAEALVMPATVQAPSHAAMRRNVAWTAKPSRVPSEQPMLWTQRPEALQYSVPAQSVSTLQLVHWLAMQVRPPLQSASVQQLPERQVPPQQTSPVAHCELCVQAAQLFATQPWPPVQLLPLQQLPAAQAPPQHS